MQDRFSVENAAMILIDHQEGTIKLARNIPHEEIMMNVRALARIAIETGMPLVLTTSLEEEFQGATIEDLQKIAPEAYKNRIKRTGVVNAWDDEKFKKAVLMTNRKKLIFAGLTNHVCTVFPSISAVKDGFEVQAAIDAGGSSTQVGDDISAIRMRENGVLTTVTDQIIAELAGTWTSGAGETIQKILQEEILSITMKNQTAKGGK